MCMTIFLKRYVSTHLSIHTEIPVQLLSLLQESCLNNFLSVHQFLNHRRKFWANQHKNLLSKSSTTPHYFVHCPTTFLSPGPSYVVVTCSMHMLSLFPQFWFCHVTFVLSWPLSNAWRKLCNHNHNKPNLLFSKHSSFHKQVPCRWTGSTGCIKRSLHAEQFSILKFWITSICYHRKECAETKTDFLHTQNMIFASFF